MTSLWTQNFSENPDGEQGINNPKDLIQEQCEYLNKQTNGNIVARVTQYDGNVKSYNTASLFDVAGGLRAIAEGSHFEVQSVLGSVGDDNSIAYEFYVTSKKTPKYKFRAFLIYHDVFIYPVTFVIEEGIAYELFGNNNIEENNHNNYTVVATDEREFVELFSKIINSKRLTTVIENLIKLNY